MQYCSKYALFNNQGCIKEMKQMIRKFMRGMVKLLRRFRVQTVGAVAIEFALVVPMILVIIYVGAIEISHALTANRKVSMVASTVGDMIAQFDRTGPDALGGLFMAATEIMQPFDDTNLRIEVFSIAGTAGAANDWNHDNSVATACTGGTPTVPPELLAAGGSVVVTQVCYEFDSVFNYFFTSGTTFSEIYLARPRRTDFITYDANL